MIYKINIFRATKISALGQLNPTVYSGLAGRGNLSIPKAAGVAPVFKNTLKQNHKMIQLLVSLK